MPFDKQLYHPEWRSIRDRIIQRAGNKCEVCGVENGAIGARNKNGEWMSELSIHQLNYDVGRELFNGEFPKMIKIILTVHHKDFDKNNNSDDNLEALCQRHHLQKDIPQHVKHAHETRIKKSRQYTMYELFDLKTGEKNDNR